MEISKCICWLWPKEVPLKLKGKGIWNKDTAVPLFETALHLPVREAAAADMDFTWTRRKDSARSQAEITSDGQRRASW